MQLVVQRPAAKDQKSLTHSIPDLGKLREDLGYVVPATEPESFDPTLLLNRSDAMAWLDLPSGVPGGTNSTHSFPEVYSFESCEGCQVRVEDCNHRILEQCCT